MADKKYLIDRTDKLSINEQCKILGLSKGSLYYQHKKYSKEDLKILNRMDELYTEYPFYGYRKVYRQLNKEGFSVGRDKILKYMHTLGLQTMYPKSKKNTSVPNKDHRTYPYLLNDVEINYPNQVWAIDITYIRMIGGFVYLVAIIDWFSKYIISYRISNSLEQSFCTEALINALSQYNKPDILNSDQGRQFTSLEFTKILLENNINISMDSKGRAIDNRIIERFFRTIKYENIYLREYKTLKQLKTGIYEYIQFYNYKRLHQSLDYKTPFEVYLKYSFPHFPLEHYEKENEKKNVFEFDKSVMKL